MAVRTAGFGMRVLYCDPFMPDEPPQVPGEKGELDALLRESDFVSVHPPLTPETRGLIDDQAFARMKPIAFLINCSRGPSWTPQRSSGLWTRVGSRAARSIRRIPNRSPTRTRYAAART